MSRRKVRNRLSLLLHCVEGGIEVCALDGDDGPDDVSCLFQSLIQTWIDGEIIEGQRTLFPSLDDSLNMLAGLNWAERLILSRFPEDDPHRAALAENVNDMALMLRRLMEAIEE